MNTHNFDQLDVWKRACRLAVDTSIAFHHTKDHPLKDQVQRAAISIPSNIAEGAKRPSRPDFLRFLGYSRGACGELRTQLMIHLGGSRDLSLEMTTDLRDLIEEAGEVSRMLGGLIRRIENEGQS